MAGPPLPVIGRDDEVAALAGFLDDLRGGPAALVLEGEAGIGKTTLFGWALAEAARRSVTVLQAGPAAAEAVLSFASLADLLEPVLDRGLAALPAPQRGALEVALLLRAPGERPPEPRAVAAGLLGVLRALAGESPVLVAVDDVQWMDAPSKAALEFCLRRLSEQPVGVLLAQRAERPGPAPLGLGRALPDERLGRVGLGPLSIGALHRVLHARAGVTFPRPVLRRLREASGGNPFFALEIARALARSGATAPLDAALPVPDNLHELVRERLAVLPAPVRGLLATAAALSAPTTSLLEASGDQGAATLMPAVAAHVVTVDGGRVVFTHPLLRSAALSSLDLDARRALHGRLAGVVADPEERARHLARSAVGADASVARALDEAARLACARGARDAAAELSEQARRLTPPDDAESRFRRGLEAAAHRYESGELVGARALLEDVVREAQPGDQRARALMELGRVRMFESDARAGTDLLREALAHASGDPALVAGVRGALASGLFLLREDLAAGEEHARAAVEYAGRDGEALELARWLTVLSYVQRLRGNTEADATLSRALALQPRLEHVRLQWQPRQDAAIQAVWRDELARARTALESLRERAAALGDESSIPYVLVHLALAECLSGELAVARAHADEGYEAALQAGSPVQQGFLLGLRALIDSHCDERACRAAAAEALALAEPAGFKVAVILARSALGLVELSLGRPAAAHAQLGSLADALEAEGVVEPGSQRFVPDDVEALIALGELEAAGSRLERFERAAIELDRPSGRAAARRCRGFAAAAVGDHNAALIAFEQALEQHARVPMPFERARTLLARGAAQRRAKRRRAARESLHEALTTFTRLGAASWEAQATRELARIGGRTASGDELTPSERRVAELVAEGRTNREVAAALYIAERTVEGHLSRVYAKAGVRSRAELARSFRAS